ncbi:YgjP-like metallopeptidase domain-containing protein, partial [Clostridium perfringens]
MYLGRNYSLQIHVDETLQNNSFVKLFRGKFHVYVKEKNDEIIKKAMEEWYREKTKEQVAKRIKYYQK